MIVSKICFYNERVGNRYVSCSIKPIQAITTHRSAIICVYCSIFIIILYRYYSTNESNPCLHRMIVYSSPMLTNDDSVAQRFPIIVQCSICSQDGVENLQLKLHDNAENSCRPLVSAFIFSSLKN